MDELENSIYGSMRKHRCSEVELLPYFLNPMLVLWEQMYIKRAYKIYFTLMSEGLGVIQVVV